MHNAFVVRMDVTVFVVLLLVSGSVSSRFLSSINHRTYILVSLSSYVTRSSFCFHLLLQDAIVSEL